MQRHDVVSTLPRQQVPAEKCFPDRTDFFKVLWCDRMWTTAISASTGLTRVSCELTERYPSKLKGNRSTTFCVTILGGNTQDNRSLSHIEPSLKGGSYYLLYSKSERKQVLSLRKPYNRCDFPPRFIHFPNLTLSVWILFFFLSRIHTVWQFYRVTSLSDYHYYYLIIIEKPVHPFLLRIIWWEINCGRKWHYDLTSEDMFIRS